AEASVAGRVFRRVTELLLRCRVKDRWDESDVPGHYPDGPRTDKPSASGFPRPRGIGSNRPLALHVAHRESEMPPQYIFTIERLSKVHGKKETPRAIWLAFYPGAKIGVLGANGAGKSPLLRIMAGVDTDYAGPARPAPGITIGFLPQEPTLDP